MKTVSTQREFDRQLGDGSCVLVPTMGALHGGHLSLIRLAIEHGQRHGLPVVATVFVNPAQFDQPEDLHRYPRTLERDAELLQREGVDVLFAPGVEDVYPDGPDGPIELPEVATQPGLEDAFRPGHFEGVCRVLERLFAMTRARAAVFGEKDWQQLQVARALVDQLGVDVEILPAETVREPDGLAMSSRNVHLSDAEREQALSISRALRLGREIEDAGRAERLMRETIEEAGLSVDYAVIREAHGLVRAPADGGAGPWRAVITARVEAESGVVRLLDNGPWPAK